MNKKIALLGLGLLVFLMGVRGGAFIFSGESKVLFGVLILAFASYDIWRDTEYKKMRKYLIGTWIFVVLCGFFTRSGESETLKLSESDLKNSRGYKGLDNCDDARESAIKDIGRGELRYIFGSIGGRQPLAENLKKYDIDVVRMYGMLGLVNECYNQVMYKKIQERYGADLFNKEMK